jgi:hypothetical protein
MDEIRASDMLKKIFSIILSIGNILNAGTAKGQADGFTLDILSKLNSIKDNTGQKNLLTYICTIMKKDDETFENVRKSFPNLNEAAKITMNDNVAILNKLKKDLKDQVGNLGKLEPDGFTEKATKLLDDCARHIDKVENDYNNLITKLQEMIVYYGYTPTDSKYKNPEEFFSCLDSFFADIDKWMPKSEPKKKFDRKHEVGKKITDGGMQGNMDALINEIKLRTTNQ